VATLGACTSHNTSPARQLFIAGTVTNEAGTPLAGATVCFAAANVCVTTDADGDYNVPYDNTQLEPLAVTFKATGYASRTARMRNATSAQATTVMRAVDTQTQITIPTGAAAAVAVKAVHGEAQTTLSIPADALVDPNSNLVAGNANVSLTFWNPIEPLTSAPANLFAADGNKQKALVTYGMADIEIEQNGQLLQVASGKKLTWSVIEPNDVIATLSPNAVVKSPFPDIYSLNTQTGLWQFEGSQASGAIAYDANTRTIAALLPHLSSWNVDADAGPQFGGCIKGRLVDPCGHPLGNKGYTIWFLGFEQLKDWRGNTSKSDGSFCAMTYLSSFNITAGRNNINYFISGADSPSDTTMCNPAPAACFNCVDENAPFSTMGWCSNCLMDPTQKAPVATGTEAPTYYNNSCGAPEINLIPYSTCDAGGCVDVGDIKLPNNATCSAGTTPATKTTPPDPCTTGVAKTEGQACASTDVCCPRDTLSCLDKTCLRRDQPPVDVTP
jgi:hypothetical protein